MSFLQGFNYSFAPNLGLGSSGFPQAPFTAPNRFSSQPNQQYTNNGPLSPTNLPIPESIAQNPQSYIDYYGNPTHPPSNGNVNNNNNGISSQNQNGFYENPQNYQQQQDFNNNNINQQQQPQPQQGRRRRTKSSRTRNAGPGPAPQGLTYGPEHVQQFQNFQNFQNFNPLPNPQQNSQQQRSSLQTQPQRPASTSDLLRVTPIQGPIYAKDGFLPVVPLYSYPHVKNGTFYQIPILWTALSYALGLEIRGEILRGLPCIKRLNQLFCPTAGNTYPLDNIERFIDENKALIKRMYGEFIMSSDAFAGPLGGNALRRSTREIYEDEVSAMFDNKNNNPTLKHSANPNKHNTVGTGGGGGTIGNGTENGAHIRTARQTVNPKNGGPTQQPKSNRVDSCESTVEVVTPYWAANSAGKVRAIVNTQHFEQAIHQEVCAKTSTKRCTGDCGCEQKYKWHRLLAYDPDNDCRGIFMDWFLFPSCCVCRCNPLI